MPQLSKGGLRYIGNDALGYIELGDNSAVKCIPTWRQRPIRRWWTDRRGIRCRRVRVGHSRQLSHTKHGVNTVNSQHPVLPVQFSSRWLESFKWIYAIYGMSHCPEYQPFSCLSCYTVEHSFIYTPKWIQFQTHSPETACKFTSGHGNS